MLSVFTAEERGLVFIKGETTHKDKEYDTPGQSYTERIKRNPLLKNFFHTQ